MNIQQAERHLDALTNYVNELKDSKPNMYKKTKERLVELALSCNRVIEVISEILQEYAMNIEDSDEFGSSSTDEITDIVRSMGDKISDLSDFVGVDSDFAPSNKTVYTTYRRCLSDASRYRYKSDVVSGCSKLLWRWFDNRFVKGNGKFVYNIMKMKDWIPYFVILYGYHFKNGTLDVFENTLNKWIIDIHVNDNKYAIPKELYILEKFHNESYFTVESVILWDLLMESSISDICNNNQNYFPYSDCVYELVYRYNPEQIDLYEEFKLDNSLLIRYGFVSGDEK